MIGIFRKNDVVNIFLLLPYTILLRIYSLIHPISYEITGFDMVFSRWFFSTIDSPLIQSIIAIILVYGQAILINLLANNHRLHRTPSALAGMFYILLVSCIPSLQILSPALIGITFILIAIFNVFRTYKITIAASNIFNAALAAAIASMIYAPYILALISLFIGISMMRNFRIKERLQFIIGFGVLIWISGAFLFFFNLLNWNFLNNLAFAESIKAVSFKDSTFLWNIGVITFLIVLILANYYNYMKKKGIEIRKKLDFFYWFLLSALLAYLFFLGLNVNHYIFIAVPLALFVSMTILSIKNKAMAELLYLFILSGVFYYQFGAGLI